MTDLTTDIAARGLDALVKHVRAIRLDGRTVALTCGDFNGAFALHSALSAARDAGTKIGDQVVVFRAAARLAFVLDRIGFASIDEEEAMLTTERDALLATLLRAGRAGDVPPPAHGEPT